jgi:hypothetical protein
MVVPRQITNLFARIGKPLGVKKHVVEEIRKLATTEHRLHNNCSSSGFLL